MKKSVFILVIVGIISLSTLPVAAMDPFQQWNYDWRNIAVHAPDAYVFEQVVDGDGLGVGPLKNPSDFFVTSEGALLVCDSGNNRIIFLDQALKVDRIIDSFQRPDGSIDALSNPTGAYLDEATGLLYIADAGHKRILILDEELRLRQSIDSVDSDILRDQFVFDPQKLAVGRNGTIHVLSSGQFEGILEFDAEGRFKGFIGAAPVRFGLLDMIWKQILTEEQTEQLIRFIPVEYSNLTLDQNGFIYAVLGTRSQTENQLIRRLSPGGDDVLRRGGSSGTPPNANLHATLLGTSYINNKLADIAVDEHGVYSVLDGGTGRVFTYSHDGSLLHVFGNKGVQAGLLSDPAAIENLGDRIIVLDRFRSVIDVYAPTRYGTAIHSALQAYDIGDFTGSSLLWKEVLKANVNLELAYLGLGRCEYRLGNFQEATRLLRLSNNKDQYSRALSKYRREFIADHFPMIFVAFLAMVLATIGIYLARKYRRHPPVPARGIVGQVAYGFHITLHPYDGFWDMIHEKRSSMLSATVWYILFILVWLFERVNTGFLFRTQPLESMNLLADIPVILSMTFLWIVMNSSMSMWVYGQAKPSDVFMMTAHSLIPFMLLRLLYTLLSNVLVLDEMLVLTTIGVLSFAWSLYLVFAGNLTVHQYTFKETIVHLLSTVAAMVITLFLCLVAYNLIQQIIGFLTTVYREIVIRR